MTLTSGTRLGGYEIVAPLGSGGMGEVYRGKDLRLGREVAIKVLPAAVTSSPDRLARFEREARTVAALNHPNVVVLYSVEDQEGIRFLTMELVDGQTLATHIVPGGLSLPRLLDLAVPMTDALAAAHEKGIIHRDLKPGNVMVSREGRVKVLDFGLAKMMEGGSNTAPGTLTVTSGGPLSTEDGVVGTIPYMSPEQLRGEPVDARSDLFSLGIILYELAAGKRPFTGETSIDVSHAILRDAPEPLSRTRGDLPAEFVQIVDRCLEKSARERVQTVQDVNNALRRVRKALERGAPERPATERMASIAVLPFANRSASQDDEYFSDGLADELLGVLSNIQGLRVTARSSSFTFKGKQATAAEIGRALNVTTLLEGSVRKAGNRIRVSVQLVNVGDSSHLWSGTYDRTLEDIFAVQDDIAQSVVKELRTTLLGEAPGSDASGKAKADVAQAAKGHGTNPEARRLLLHARHLLDRATRDDYAKAIEYLHEALALDPEYALVWTELSRAHGLAADQGFAPVAEGYGRARQAAERALSLDPDLAEGHLEMAWIRLVFDWDFRGAEASFARALELSPGNSEVLRGAGALARMVCRFEDAIRLTRGALEQDPLNAAAYSHLGYTLLQADRAAEAEGAYRKALELAPNRGRSRSSLSLVLLNLGRGVEGLEEASRDPHETYRLQALAILHHGLGHGADSEAALRELIQKHEGGAAFQIAEVHGARGEIDTAFEWLERAYAQRDGGLTSTRSSPFLRSLHRDPRWGAFVKKMGLED